MVYGAFIIKYPGFHKIEILCVDFDKPFASNLYRRGWSYDRTSGRLFYKIFKKTNKKAIEKYQEALDYLNKSDIKVRVVNLTAF